MEQHNLCIHRLCMSVFDGRQLAVHQGEQQLICSTITHEALLFLNRRNVYCHIHEKKLTFMMFALCTAVTFFLPLSFAYLKANSGQR